MVGVYGVRAIMVGRRTREFGIRVAIGATPGEVMRLVMTEGARLIVVGLGAGLLLSAGLSRVLAGWIYGIRTFEPGVFVTTSLLLVLAMLAACYLPARRATAVEPATALRNE
jgi:putative ABC transport system permease protein